jgi:hypothetical protein
MEPAKPRSSGTLQRKTKDRKAKRTPGPTPLWYPRIPLVLRTLEEAGKAPFVTRSGIEKLLGVRQRQAIVLMHRWGASRIGRDLVLRRETLVAVLRSLLRGESYEIEQGRQEKLVAELRRSRAAPLRFAAGPAKVAVANLPAGVTLTPGRIEVEFSTPKEAVERLYALALALVNDFGAFEKVADPAKEGSGAS